MASPCITCKHATPVEAFVVVEGPVPKRGEELTLRCDWSPPVEQPHWFVPGMRLCEMDKPIVCDAWERKP